ncbi:aryl-sulfate sulfotransferase [Nocardioides sp.]|uniref:aryl-sulfate sulfotransferase n=1 Tax=Nocardioides sp. TaxID=35761 RepID=UPI0037842A55
MIGRSLLLSLPVCLVCAGLGVGSVQPAAADDGTGIEVTVTGPGASTWPAYDAGVDRFAIATTVDSTGSVTVAVTGASADAVVLVDGAPAPGGTAEVDGLTTGDEVDVQVVDGATSTNQSWIYLPPGFPELTTTASGAGPTPGRTFLGLISYYGKPFETVVHEHGVPVHVRAGAGTDLKPSGDGYVVARPAEDGSTEIVELDDQFQPVASHQLVGMPASTDNHDVEVLPDGSVLMMGYDAATRGDEHWQDAVIQLVDPQGDVAFEWNSRDHVDPAEALVHGQVTILGTSFDDYAHINSLQLVGEHQDVLASFRNLSQVRLIATQAHDGHQPGDTIWIFGGGPDAGSGEAVRPPRFTLTDGEGSRDPGPCAQHMARLLPDGDLTLFDNGSRAGGNQMADMCEDPADPEGPRIARPQTRVTQYALDLSDPEHPSADLVWHYAYPHRYAAFAGSQQRLDNGNTVIGWSQAVDGSGGDEAQPIATEVTADGSQVWRLDGFGYFTYRATHGQAPDRIPPEVTLSGPEDGGTYEPGTDIPVTYSCTDRGGSNLDGCDGTVDNGGSAPTTPGQHTVTVTASDRAGNTTSSSVTYTVTAPPPVVVRPDLSLRRSGDAWVGRGVSGPARDQSVTLDLGPRGTARHAAVRIRLANLGTDTQRYRLTGGTGATGFTIAFRRDGVDVTRRLTGAGLTTPALAPGQTYDLVATVSRNATTRPGGRVLRGLATVYTLGGARMDGVAVRPRAVR